MRIAVLTHGLHNAAEAQDEYAIGLIAELWRADGHDVRFLVGENEYWPADIAVLHVDNTVVPNAYVRLAARYPVVINGTLTDIRKTKVSSPAVWPKPGYSGPVFVKSDLNSAGIPERLLSGRSAWRRLRRWLAGTADEEMDWNKRYAVYDSLVDVPHELLRRPNVIVQRFIPEIEGGKYFIRRCFALGERIICYRMGHSEPVVDAHEEGLFSWIDAAPEVVAWRRRLRHGYGTIDYVVHEGEVVVLDVNKTPGRARPPDAPGQRDYERIIAHVAPGLADFVSAQPTRLP